eukprot:2647176-Prymnesium_polylepis.1
MASFSRTTCSASGDGEMSRHYTCGDKCLSTRRVADCAQHLKPRTRAGLRCPASGCRVAARLGAAWSCRAKRCTTSVGGGTLVSC